MKGSKWIIFLVVLYLAYMVVLFKPPRRGWDILVVKITLALISTVFFLVLVAGYMALRNKFF